MSAAYRCDQCRRYGTEPALSLRVRYVANVGPGWRDLDFCGVGCAKRYLEAIEAGVHGTVRPGG